MSRPIPGGVALESLPCQAGNKFRVLTISPPGPHGVPSRPERLATLRQPLRENDQRATCGGGREVGEVGTAASSVRILILRSWSAHGLLAGGSS